MLQKQREDVLIVKLRNMLKEERAIAVDLQDQDFIIMVESTLRRLEEQQRERTPKAR